MSITFLGQFNANGISAFDSDVLAWEAAVIANGGTVSLARGLIVNRFVRREKASGSWALTDDYIGLWGENAIQGRTSLKQLRLASEVGTPTFTASRGYTSSASNYVDSGFIPSTHSTLMSQNNISAGVYVRTDLDSTTQTALGVGSTNNRLLRICPRSNSALRAFGNSTLGTWILQTSTGIGYSSVQRNGAAGTDVSAYKNGILLSQSFTPTALGVDIPAQAIAIGAYNDAGTPTNYFLGEVSFVRFGAALSSAQHAAHYAAVLEWASAIGAA